MRSFLSYLAELEDYLEHLGSPTFVCIIETFLDKSVIFPRISNYDLISRLGRRHDKTGGGIAFFARSCVSNCVVHEGDSDRFERTSHILHADQGPLLFGLWYRPPAYGEIDSITSLEAEVRCHAANVIGTILVGDMNVHHKPWLKYSASCTPAGRHLFRFWFRGVCSATNSWPLFVGSCFVRSGSLHLDRSYTRRQRSQYGAVTCGFTGSGVCHGSPPLLLLQASKLEWTKL
ncbi:unnamed protein product [Polarella glacialis]|uniref:Endonuclease/exonuclease/phosphatase domain-containing protein n=1 Tax=Polarella glacialis TaxID=89957 RepID=A0A813J0F6_POLGL|nr:unnamed protein product [Polarella glacialis]